MIGWRRVRRLVHGWLRRAQVDESIDEELRTHVEMEAEDLMRVEGLDAAEARRRALIAFGGYERMRERARDARHARWLDDLLQDCLFGVRTLRRSPGFAAVAVLTLMLGVGATTAMFTVVNSVLLKPLPYPESSRLVAVWGRFLPESGFDFAQFPLSPPEYFDYRAQNRVLADVAAHNGFRATLADDDGRALSVRGARTTANLFDVLRVTALHGRVYTPAEDVADGPRVVVIGHALWQRAYGADPAIAGRTIRVNGSAAEVIGVMPPDFAYPSVETELWMPAGLDPARDLARSSHYLGAVGRLARGVPIERAHDEMTALMEQWKTEHPDVHAGHFLFLQPLLDNDVGTARPALLALLGAVAFVLLIVCANLANLLLARGEARRHELALRSALGAGRFRLLRQFLAEGVVLSVIGGTLGLALAYALVRATVALGAASIPRASAVAPDARVLLFTAAVALFTTLVFALAPLTGLGSAEPRTVMGDGGRSTSAGRGLRMRRMLVTVQIALAVIVVTGAGLMMRSFAALASVDAGFSADRVLLAELSLPAGSYASDTAVIAYYGELVQRLGRLPGVRAAAATSTLPLGGYASNIDFRIDGMPPPAPGEPAHSGDLIITDAGFTDAFGVQLVEGRFFESTDRAGSQPVVVVNSTLARMFWPGEHAVGRRLRIADSDERPWLEVVGVIDDVQFRGPADDVRPAWYLPLAQMTQSLGQPARMFNVAVRTQLEPASITGPVRDVIRELDPALPVIRLRPLDTVLSEAFARPRFTTTVLGLFGALALLLGAIGVYGVLAYSVARRTREFGIRRALGADWRELCTLVLGEGLRMVLLGLALGLAGAVAATRLIESLLFGVNATDPATFAAVGAGICVVAIAASAAPLVRTLLADPVRALRSE